MHSTDTRLARARLALRSTLPSGGEFYQNADFQTAMVADPTAQRFGRDIAYLGRSASGSPAGLWVRFTKGERDIHGELPVGCHGLGHTGPIWALVAPCVRDWS